MKQLFLITVLMLCIQYAVSQTTKDEIVPVIAIVDVPPPSRPEVFTIAEEMPEYPEGREALSTYIENNIKLPKKVKKNAISAKVYARFIVTEQGTATDIVILRGINDCKECEEETVRLIKSIKKWKPAKMGGQPVKCYFNLPIKFESK